mmetsp:Transcript_59800/g.160076  ORF Transcript_59800/g.160076 Transcript_59800/m.160076 type:complete len:204 (+) Transcript_59800:296-907(+)
MGSTMMTMAWDLIAQQRRTIWGWTQEKLARHLRGPNVSRATARTAQDPPPTRALPLQLQLLNRCAPRTTGWALLRTAPTTARKRLPLDFGPRLPLRLVRNLQQRRLLRRVPMSKSPAAVRLLQELRRQSDLQPLLCQVRNLLPRRHERTRWTMTHGLARSPTSCRNGWMTTKPSLPMPLRKMCKARHLLGQKLWTQRFLAKLG